MELFNKTFFRFTGMFAAMIGLVFLFLAALQEWGSFVDEDTVPKSDPIPSTSDVPLEAARG